jgi:hypothetical protein
MKYIVGTNFTVKNKKFKIKGPLTSSMAKQLSRASNNDILQEGDYKIMHIKKVDDYLHYIFKYNDTETVIVEFDDSKEADALIGTYLG